MNRESSWRKRQRGQGKADVRRMGRRARWFNPSRALTNSGRKVECGSRAHATYLPTESLGRLHPQRGGAVEGGGRWSARNQPSTSLNSNERKELLLVGRDACQRQRLGD